MRKKIDIAWLDEPERHNYPAALAYLTLVFKGRVAASYVRKLRAAPITLFKSKDIMRASGLPLLAASNTHLERDRRKILDGERLSPLLLVRHPPTARVIVADGYHRLCAIHTFDEDAVIPCKFA